jgi:hypothetical protein
MGGEDKAWYQSIGLVEKKKPFSRPLWAGKREVVQ